MRRTELGPNVDRYNPYLPTESPIEVPHVEADVAVVLTGYAKFASLNNEELDKNGNGTVYNTRKVVDRQIMTIAGIAYIHLTGITKS
jgi:UDP-N-acetyl-D-mannosaminuronate dehydrogenase